MTRALARPPFLLAVCQNMKWIDAGLFASEHEAAFAAAQETGDTQIIPLRTGDDPQTVVGHLKRAVVIGRYHGPDRRLLLIGFYFGAPNPNPLLNRHRRPAFSRSCVQRQALVSDRAGCLSPPRLARRAQPIALRRGGRASWQTRSMFYAAQNKADVALGRIAERRVAVGQPQRRETKRDDKGERGERAGHADGSRQSITRMKASGANSLTSLRQACASGADANFTMLPTSVVRLAHVERARAHQIAQPVLKAVFGLRVPSWLDRAARFRPQIAIIVRAADAQAHEVVDLKVRMGA